MNDRKCTNCNERIIPESYESATAKIEYAANVAAWVHGYCSRWCMVAHAMTQMKSGTTWWLKDSTPDHE